MASMNHVTIIGNMTRDPEMKYTQQGTGICDFNVAVNRKWKDKASGEQKEEVSFIECVAFGRTGELVAQYLKKGRQVGVEGYLKQDRWEDKASGQKRSKTRVVATNVIFLGGKPGEGGTAAEPVVVVDDDNIEF